ncbi:hypothetical protein FACS1894122_05160 [Alphaproteobacteria bacterium]|nr:hypothetical protein FACS1894122_05160 [Alphaproteobacteria bacterium]
MLCFFFFNKRIYESIEKKAFSPAIVFALYAKSFDAKLISEAGRYDIPDIKVLSGDNFSGHILLASCQFDCYMDVYILYANKDRSIEKICIRECDHSEMVKGNRFSVDYGKPSFYKWDSDKKTLTFFDHELVQNREDIKTCTTKKILHLFQKKSGGFFMNREKCRIHMESKAMKKTLILLLLLGGCTDPTDDHGRFIKF